MVRAVKERGAGQFGADNARAVVVQANQQTAQPIFLPAQEAAAFLRISTVTLSRWRIQGQGPAFRKFGRRVVYSREELITWAESQRRHCTSSASPEKSGALTLSCGASARGKNGTV